MPEGSLSNIKNRVSGRLRKAYTQSSGAERKGRRAEGLGFFFYLKQASMSTKRNNFILIIFKYAI